MIPTWTVLDRMKKAREAAGLEQEDMAARLGVARNTVSRWEIGKSPVKVGTLKAWSLETGVPFYWLQWGMTEAPTPTPVGAEAGASMAKLPRLDSNQQPAGYGTLHPRQAAGVVTDLGSKRERAARVQRLRLEGGAAA